MVWRVASMAERGIPSHSDQKGDSMLPIMMRFTPPLAENWDWKLARRQHRRG